MVFVDTRAWFAAVVPSDANHPQAASWLAANSEVLITTDYVIDEILTLLRARGERQRAGESQNRRPDPEFGSFGTIVGPTEEYRDDWAMTK